MVRSDWGIVFAVVGWLSLLAANESKLAPQNISNAQATTQSNASSEVTKPTPQTVTTPETPEAQPKDSGCADGKDRRNSDLCAQWKAADAAFDSARATERQIIIGWLGLALGAVTMVAAIAAAIYARKAAHETKRSAKAAEDALSQAQHVARAWLSIAVEAEKITSIEHSRRFYYRVTIKNVGAVVAENLQWHHNVFDIRHGDRVAARKVKSWELRRRKTESIIQPGESISTSIWSFDAESSFVWDNTTSRAIFHPGLLIYATYNVAGDEMPRYSKRTFAFTQRYAAGSNSYIDALLAPYGQDDPINFYISQDRLPLSGNEISMEPRGSHAT